MRASKLIVVSAAVAVVVGVGIAVVVLRRDSGLAPPVGTGISAPLRYSPTWLPPGLVERRRTIYSQDRDRASVHRSGRIIRTWFAGSTPPEFGGTYVGLTVSRSSPQVGCSRGAEVDVNGRRANHYVSDDKEKACVSWQPDDGTWVEVGAGGPGLGPEDALRVARSMRADAALLVVPFHIDKRQEVRYGDSIGTYAEIEGDSPANWAAKTTMGPTAKNNPRDLIVQLGTTTPAPAGGTPVDVGGRSARYLTAFVGNANNAYLVVDLGQGLLLTVRYWMTQAELPPMSELVKVAERTRIGVPDVAWVGSRPPP